MSFQNTRSPAHIDFRGRVKNRIFREIRKATWRQRALPDFLVIGCQKGGTTSLFHYLNHHPQITSAEIKEVHFFDGGLNPKWDKFIEGEGLYRSYFPWITEVHASQSLCFEASPCYMFNPLAPRRMAMLVPNVKLIVLLRNPVERAISHYFHEVRRGRETLQIMDAFQAEDERLYSARRSGNYKDPRWINQSYVERGLYAQQLENVFKYYTREHVLILDSAEFYSSPLATITTVLDFIGLDSMKFNVDLTPVGVGTNRIEVESYVYKYLYERFREPNIRLQKLLNRRFEWSTS